MLVLSRKRGETIVIGDNIVVEVLEIRGGLVRLGIQAPRGVEVHRHEVWLSIQEERNTDTDVPNVEHRGISLGARIEMEVEDGDGLDTAMLFHGGNAL